MEERLYNSPINRVSSEECVLSFFPSQFIYINLSHPFIISKIKKKIISKQVGVFATEQTTPWFCRNYTYYREDEDQCLDHKTENIVI